jgi:hypothetical protein
VIGSQLSYRAVSEMETVEFCGQTCHAMKPQFTAHMQPPHAALDCVACHVAPGATGFVQAKLAGTRQLFEVMASSYPRPIPSAMASNRLVSSAETCEQCHQRNQPMQPRLRVMKRFPDDEANTPTQTALMVMADKIHAAHLSAGVEAYGSAEASSKIEAGLNDFYRQKHPDVFSKGANDINSAARALAAIYSRTVFPDLKVTWETYPNNLGHTDYPGCFRCHDGSHVTKTNESITEDCGACHNAIAVDESSPEVLKTL